MYQWIEKAICGWLKPKLTHMGWWKKNQTGSCSILLNCADQFNFEKTYFWDTWYKQKWWVNELSVQSYVVYYNTLINLETGQVSAATALTCQKSVRNEDGAKMNIHWTDNIIWHFYKQGFTILIYLRRR